MVHSKKKSEKMEIKIKMLELDVGQLQKQLDLKKKHLDEAEKSND